MEMENKKLLFALPHDSRSIVHQLKLSNFNFKIKKWKHSVRQCLTQPEIQMFSKINSFFTTNAQGGLLNTVRWMQYLA